MLRLRPRLLLPYTAAQSVRCLSSSSAPVNIPQFVRENSHKLRPPVGNAMLFDGRILKVMLVGGPNARSDYHIEKGEELFVQLQGNVHIDIVEQRRPRRLCLHQDNLLVLPPGVPHSPQRYANTVGLVVERTRSADEKDCLRWYAPQERSGGGGAELAVAYEESFHCRDLGSQIKQVIERYLSRASSSAASAPSSSSSPLDEYFGAASTPPSSSFTHLNHTIAGEGAINRLQGGRGGSPLVSEVARTQEFSVHVVSSPRPAPAEQWLPSAWVPIASGEVLVWQARGEAMVEFAAPSGGGASSEVLLRAGDALLMEASSCRMLTRGASRVFVIENVAPVG